MLGKPSTKKTSQNIVWTGGKRKRPKIQPSKAYQAAIREQLPQLQDQYKGEPLGGPDQKLWVVASYLFKDGRHEPDLDNLNTSLADILAKSGVIKNDRHIQSWDGSRKYMYTGVEGTHILILPYEPVPLKDEIRKGVDEWIRKWLSV